VRRGRREKKKKSPASLVVLAEFGKVPGSKLKKLQLYGRHISNA